MEFIVREQVGEVPEQAPDHPPKVELASGVALMVTVVPALKVVPAGFVAMLPFPGPVFVKVKL